MDSAEGLDQLILSRTLMGYMVRPPICSEPGGQIIEASQPVEWSRPGKVNGEQSARTSGYATTRDLYACARSSEVPTL